MAKNKARKKEQKKAKALKRRRSTTTRPVSVDEKVSRVRASAYPDESLEDRAVFEDAARAKLPKELAAQIDQVRKSLACLHDGRDGSAESVLADIPRRSPMSDWRLLVRGLIHWYAGDSEKAAEAFARLDPNRRPARIAETLRYSDEMKDRWTAQPGVVIEHPSGLDQAIFSGANLVHRVRNVRSGLAEAQQEFRKRERLPDFDGLELPEDFPGPLRMSWLMAFCENHSRHEPWLVSELINNVLRHLTHVPLAPLMEDFAEPVSGDMHDPQNFLRRAMYYGKFQGGESEVDSFRKKYLDWLRTQKVLSKPLAAALTAEVHLDAARFEQEEGGPGGLGILLNFGPGPDSSVIQKHFLAATKACPGHVDAHQEFIDWIEAELEEPRIDKAREKKLQNMLGSAMTSYAQGCPEEIDPRLWLVDHYLENEQLQLAEPHVRWLADSRNVDLRVRATQWKWHLLEAMRLSRRKTWLPKADEQLDAAEKIWPVWLSKDWLPYFRAARWLRAGKPSEYESTRQEIRGSWNQPDAEHERAADAVAMLGAAQRMRVPAADLKPLRKAVDDLVKDLSVLSHVELLRLGRFFTEMFRAGMVYPAYRMHGSKFADELAYRMLHGELNESHRNHPDFWPAMFWLAYQRTWVGTNNTGLPIPALLTKSDSPEKVAAITLQIGVSSRRRWLIREAVDAIPVLEEALPNEKDVYLKYWYCTLIEKGKEKKSQFDRAMGGGGMFERLRSMMAGVGIDDDDVDLQCDCLECTATRERLGIPHPWE